MALMAVPDFKAHVRKWRREEAGGRGAGRLQAGVDGARIFLCSSIMLPLILFPLFCHFPLKALSSVHNSLSAGGSSQRAKRKRAEEETRPTFY